MLIPVDLKEFYKFIGQHCIASERIFTDDHAASSGDGKWLA